MNKQIKKNTKDIKLLLNPSIRQDIFHPTRLLYALIGILIFVIIGYYAPKVWVQYNGVNYYSVEQPVGVDKEIYKQCEKIATTLKRTSSINDIVHSTVQIYLINADSLTKHDPLFNGDVVVEQSNSIILHTVYTIPCDLPDGKYFIQAVIKYHISGIEKTYLWATRSFTVSQTLSE